MSARSSSHPTSDQNSDTGAAQVSLWRTFLTGRWLLLFAVLIGIIVGFAQLGLWQMSVARDDAETRAYAERAELQARPLADLLAPYESFPDDLSLAPVLISGEYDTEPGREFLIADRRLDGAAGYWVTTRLVTQEGAWIAMVRGFVTDPDQVPPAPTGVVSVEGVLAPGESAASSAGLPEGQRGSLDLSALVNQWPGDPYNAFVLVQAESGPGVSATASQAQELQRIPAPVIGGEPDWRNLGYAMQWWVFAAFAAFMYYKFLRDAHRSRLRRRVDTLDDPDSGPGHGSGRGSGGGPGGSSGGGSGPDAEPDAGRPPEPRIEHVEVPDQNRERQHSEHV